MLEVGWDGTGNDGAVDGREDAWTNGSEDILQESGGDNVERAGCWFHAGDDLCEGGKGNR